MIEAIAFADFCSGIAPLWKTEPTSIPIWNNPYGVIQYSDLEARENILFRGMRWVEDGVVKAHSSIYNVSDSVLRIRGIYVEPEFRGQGIAHKMIAEMWSLWPASFNRIVGWWRNDSWRRFVEHSKMKIVPETDWFWSDFSQVRMRMLYLDRADGISDNTLSQHFITENHDMWGFSSSQNLNRSWCDEEWLGYVRQHRGSYPDTKIRLDFLIA